MVNVDAVLLKVLKKLQQEVSVGTFPQSGICSYVSMSMVGWPYGGNYRSAYHRMKELMIQWPLSTKSKSFPVPFSETNKSVELADRAYHSHESNRTLWGDNEHAELRKQLLSWMIEQLEKRV